MAKTLRVRTRTGWTTKPFADEPENRLSAEEMDDNFLALEDEVPNPEYEVGQCLLRHKNSVTAGWLALTGERVSNTTYPLLTPYLRGASDFTVGNTFTVSNGDTASFSHSPAGTYTVILEDVSPWVHIVDPQTLTPISGTPVFDGFARGISFTPDDSLMAVGGGTANLRVFNTATWDEVNIGAHGITEIVKNLEFSADGVYLAVVVDLAPYIYVLNVSNWTQVSNGPVHQISRAPNSVHFSPDNQLLVTTASPLSGDSGITLYTVSDWQVVTSFRDVFNTCLWAAFKPPGSNFLAVATDDGAYVFDVSTGEELFEPDFSAAIINQLAFSSDGRYLAINGGTDSMVKVVDTTTWTYAKDFSDPFGTQYSGRYVSFNPTWSFILAGGSFDVVARKIDVTATNDGLLPEVTAEEYYMEWRIKAE